MKDLKKYIIAIAISTFFSINYQAHAGAGVSKVTLPDDCLHQIEIIRKDFADIFSKRPQEYDSSKRLTIMIVPFQESECGKKLSRRQSERQFFAQGLGANPTDELKKSSRKSLARHQSECQFARPLSKKAEKLIGCSIMPDQIPVPCANWKYKIFSLINKKDLTPAQKLSVLKLLCEPCSEGTFIYGNVDKIQKLKPEQVISIESSMEETNSGLLNITCRLTDGNCLVCFI